MKWYCEKCKKIHDDDELCPEIKKQLAKHREWIPEAANFAVVAGEEALITRQTLNGIAQSINKIAGTDLSYEGTHQFARDIQVFRRLNDEAFSRSGHFSSPEAAKNYLENVLKAAEDKPGALKAFENKLTGYGQEVDWVRKKHGEVSSLWEKNKLLNNNAPGVDGITVNRFNGKQISRTTIKASQNPMTSNSTGIKDIIEAIEKGAVGENDVIFGPEGIEMAAEDAGLKNPVVEENTPGQIKNSNKRLEEKILDGQATTAPTPKQVGLKTAQGAVVGAAVAVTVSTITTYIRYKSGELTKDEAFRDVAEKTANGALVGSAMSAVTIFLPGGVIGFVAGMAVGVYVDKLCANILDEVFGNGAYGKILNAAGYVYGMTLNLAECYDRIAANNGEVRANIRKASEIEKEIDDNFRLFEQLKG